MTCKDGGTGESGRAGTRGGVVRTRNGRVEKFSTLNGLGAGYIYVL